MNGRGGGGGDGARCIVVESLRFRVDDEDVDVDVRIVEEGGGIGFGSGRVVVVDRTKLAAGAAFPRCARARLSLWSFVFIGSVEALRDGGFEWVLVIEFRLRTCELPFEAPFTLICCTFACFLSNLSFLLDFRNPSPCDFDCSAFPPLFAFNSLELLKTTFPIADPPVLLLRRLCAYFVKSGVLRLVEVLETER